VTHALGIAARARSLHRALSETGIPCLGTLLKVLAAVGVTLRPKRGAGPLDHVPPDENGRPKPPVPFADPT
jgi:hypothetical protein